MSKERQTIQIDEKDLAEIRTTQEYQAIGYLRKTITIQLTTEDAKFVEEEALRENLNVDIVGSDLFNTGLKLIRQVRQWRQEETLLEAKKYDSFYANQTTEGDDHA